MKDQSRVIASLRKQPKRLIREDSGQTIIMFALGLVVMITMAGFVIDIGRAMVVNARLKSSTIASALAGATDMPSTSYTTAAQTTATQDDTDQGLGTITSTTSACSSSSSSPCLSFAAEGYCSPTASSLNVGCITMGGSNTVNALVVTQSTTMPTTFISILGIKSLTFTTTEAAAWKGSAHNPYNVAVIVDSTDSMNDTDTCVSGSGCSASNDPCDGQTAFYCALLGVQSLLKNLTPCPGGGNCSGEGPLDEVALYTFPGLSNTAAATADATCSASITSASSASGGFGVNDSTTYYGFPGSSGSLTPGTPVYQMVGFSDNYKSADTNTSLNTSSDLVIAAGGGSNCSYDTDRGGLQVKGGAGTFYAGVIYQAQSDLYNEYETRLSNGSQTSNVMILLSDGDATSTATELGGDQTTTSTSENCTGPKNHQTCTPVTTTTTTLTANSDNSFSAPSAGSPASYVSNEDLCQQAVTAAESATNGNWPSGNSSNVGTTVYTVAYGSETTACSGETLTPCQTMQEMSSSYLQNQQNPSQYPNATEDFYYDGLDQIGRTQTDTTCGTGTANSAIADSIPDIFEAIAGGLSSSKIMGTTTDTSACSAYSTTGCP
ncbi:MAG TPA: Tad domain-containing protein [Acidobacteriaceae bacterium]|nr:Tad domain-containing protein [Acidobacteriaceae bacterium]